MSYSTDVKDSWCSCGLTESVWWCSDDAAVTDDSECADCGSIVYDIAE